MSPAYRKQSVVKTPWFELVEKKYEGANAPYYVMEVPDYVSIIARNKMGRLVLVRQYRHALDMTTTEFPSGHVDPGETPLQSAQRELLEETAYHGGTWTALTSLHSDVGRICNLSHTYFADQVEKHPTQPQEAGIELLEIPAAELIAMAMRGQFSHSIHVASLFLARENKLL